MSAMEKMVAGMLGITPAEMSAMMTGFQDLLKNLGATLAEIKEQGEKNAAMLAAIMERLENDDGSKRGGNPGRKRLPNSSPGGTGADAGSGAGSGD